MRRLYVPTGERDYKEILAIIVKSPHHRIFLYAHP